MRSSRLLLALKDAYTPPASFASVARPPLMWLLSRFDSTPEPKNPAGMLAMSKKDLRAKLLATPAMSDRSWAAYREANDIDAKRNAGESRVDYINRVLAG